MSTRKLAVGLSLMSVLAVGLLMSSGSVLGQGTSISIVKDAALKADKSYDPSPAQVKVGDTVTWTNDDSQIHTATSGTAGSADSGSVFDSKILSPGATFDFKFDKAGEYDYYCTMHPQMLGKVTVS
jgi:plastocyanin